jgi:hypothetical protein
MRSVRLGLLFFLLFQGAPTWSQQAPPSFGQSRTPQSSSQAIRDPEAVTIVQDAITAIGGATAISQAQSWTFQAQMQGARANGSTAYVMSTDSDRGKIARPDGTTRPARAIHSLFVPALVGSILLNEFGDPDFSLYDGGLSSLDSKPVRVIIFSAGPIQIPGQIWYFDAANLPVQVDFRLPAEIGARQSLYGLVSLLDYRAVSGVMYPFRIVTFAEGRPPQVVTLESVATDTTAPLNQFNGPAGDLR